MHILRCLFTSACVCLLRSLGSVCVCTMCVLVCVPICKCMPTCLHTYVFSYVHFRCPCVYTFVCCAPMSVPVYTLVCRSFCVCPCIIHACLCISYVCSCVYMCGLVHVLLCVYPCACVCYYSYVMLKTKLGNREK